MVLGEKLTGKIKSTNRKGLLFLILFFTVSIAQAQYTSRLGRFQVDQKKRLRTFYSNDHQYQPDHHRRMYPGQTLA